jgi:hypothetical protein
VKRVALILLLGSLAGVGCVGGPGSELPSLTGKSALPSPTPEAPPPEVKPSEINDKNFREKVRELEAEIAHDEHSN